MPATKLWTEQTDFEKNDATTNADTTTVQGSVQITSAISTVDLGYTTQSDFQRGLQTNILYTTFVNSFVIIGSGAASSASGYGRWDSPVMDTGTTGAAWQTLAFTKTFTPASGDVGWDIRTSDTSFNQADGSPSFVALGSGASSITLTQTGRYGQIRSVPWASGLSGTTTHDSSTRAIWSMNNNGTDESVNGLNLSLNGDAAYSSLQSKFGGYSLLNADGASNYAFNNSWTVNSTTFTAEAWVYPTDLTTHLSAIMGSRVTRGFYMYIGTNGTVTVYGEYPSATQIFFFTSVGTVSTNTWTHVALTLDGTTARLFIGGTLDGSEAVTAAINDPAGSYIRIGQGVDNVTNYAFRGNIDEVRLSTTARYTANFTPPTAEFGTLSPFSYPGSPRIDDITITAASGTVVSASGMIMSNAWDTLLPSGQYDFVSWDRTNNAAHLQLSVRTSGTAYVGNWVTLSSGTISNGITNYDLRDDTIWGKALQWKADLFRNSTSNNPRLNSVSLSFGSGSTQPRTGERGGAWTQIYSA